MDAQVVEKSWPLPYVSNATVYALITLLVTFLGWALLKRHRFVQMVNQIAGPPTEIPLWGGGAQVIVPPDELMNLLHTLHTVWGRSVSGLLRVWIGPVPLFFATTAESAESVLSSNKIITKSREYDFLHPWLATGLLTSTDDKWHQRRRLLTPSFHFKILEDFLHVFNEMSRIMVKKLHDTMAKEDDFNIYPFVTRCTLDIICETAMGRNVDAQSKTDSEYVQAVYKIARVVQLRQARFYLRPEWLFRLTKYWPIQQKSLEILHGFTNQVIRERKLEHKQKKLQHQQRGADVDKAVDDELFTTKRRRLAFLDLLIEASEDGAVLSDADIREEVDTFMFEGHDTTAAAISWSVFLIGSHPHVQELVQEELIKVFADSDRGITMADLNELKYLECCIKEALRLYPSVPLMGRQVTEDTVIGGQHIPAGNTISIFPYYLHRDPRFFPDPDLFKPERFFVENSRGRHPYAYVPFSAGPRNCIGQRFALMEEKTVLAWLFRNFHVKSLDSRDEVIILGELVLKPRDGVRVHLTPRGSQSSNPERA